MFSLSESGYAANKAPVKKAKPAAQESPSIMPDTKPAPVATASPTLMVRVPNPNGRAISKDKLLNELSQEFVIVESFVDGYLVTTAAGQDYVLHTGADAGDNPGPVLNLMLTLLRGAVEQGSRLNFIIGQPSFGEGLEGLNIDQEALDDQLNDSPIGNDFFDDVAIDFWNTILDQMLTQMENLQLQFGLGQVSVDNWRKEENEFNHPSGNLAHLSPEGRQASANRDKTHQKRNRNWRKKNGIIMAGDPWDWFGDFLTGVIDQIRVDLDGLISQYQDNELGLLQLHQGLQALIDEGVNSVNDSNEFQGQAVAPGQNYMIGFSADTAQNGMRNILLQIQPPD